MKNNRRIRPLIISTGLFMATMMFQTASNSIGTLVAFATILMCLVCYFIENKFKIYLVSTSIAVVFFVVLSFCVTMFRSALPSYYTKLIAQMVLFVFLLSFAQCGSVNDQEEKYLSFMFIVSTVVYTVVGIATSYTSSRYYHGDIVLFGTNIDPNFFGIPIVAASTLLLYLILNSEKHKILYIIGYIILFISVFLTASKGNMIGLITGNGLVLINYIFSRNTSFTKKVGYFLLIAFLFYFMYGYIQENFLEAWVRMTSIGQKGSDNSRFELWKRALGIWMKNPIFGGGLYANYLTFGKAAHNTYLQILSETGLVGIFAMGTVLLSMLKRAYKTSKVYAWIFVSLLVQIFFLDALDNRCLWSILCWFAVLSCRRRSTMEDEVNVA